MADPVNLEANKLVSDLRTIGPDMLPPTSSASAAEQYAATAEGAGVPQESPDRRYFVGYLGNGFEFRGEEWCVLYLDESMQTWLLIQASGVVARKELEKETETPAARDVIWVKGDAAVSRGTGALSLEGLFLTGSFARAADFGGESLGGGTIDPGTGMFGGAGPSPPRCCTRTNRRP